MNTELHAFDNIPESDLNFSVKKEIVKVVDFDYNLMTKTGHIELSNGKRIGFYNYDYKIKMNFDHNLNQIRLLLSQKNKKLGNKNEYYSADYYHGKNESYYTVTYHRNGRQKMICKGYNPDLVFRSLSQLEGFRDLDVANYPIIDINNYHMYLNYLKYKKRIDIIIDKYIKGQPVPTKPGVTNRIPANVFANIPDYELPSQAKSDEQIKFESITKDLLRAITLGMTNGVVYAHNDTGAEPMYNSFSNYFKCDSTEKVLDELDHSSFDLESKIANMYDQVIKALKKRGKVVYRVGAYNHDRNEGSVWTEYYTIDKDKGLDCVKQEIEDMIDLNRDDENAWYGQTFQEWAEGERAKMFCEIV